MAESKPLDLNWGRQTAESLWRAYAAMGGVFPGKRLLDFGCSWGYFCWLALERGCSEVVGVDRIPHWERLEDASLVQQPGLRLYAGDLLKLAELEREQFDVIVSAGTLFLLDSEYLDHVLGWFCDHLRPGGEALLRTRCMTAKSYNDLGSRLGVAGAQLLFSRRDINAVLTEKAQVGLKSHLSYTGASWIFACHGAGFDVVNVQRFSNPEVVELARQHPAKLRHIDPVELATGEILIHLRKPVEPRDFSSLRKHGT